MMPTAINNDAMFEATDTMEHRRSDGPLPPLIIHPKDQDGKLQTVKPQKCETGYGVDQAGLYRVQCNANSADLAIRCT